MISTVARIDGSVGWTVMIAAGGELFLAYLPRDTYDRIHDMPNLLVAGSVQPARDCRGQWMARHWAMAVRQRL